MFLLLSELFIDGSSYSAAQPKGIFFKVIVFESMYTKLQGVREYLEQTGVTLPEPEAEAPAALLAHSAAALGESEPAPTEDDDAEQR